MTTARDIIKPALRKISELGVGQDLSAEDAQDALRELNAMIALWSTDGALIYLETKETFPLTGAQSYTIGSGADFDTTVPVDIKSAYVSYSGNDYPIQLIDNEEYACIADKDLTGIPSQLYFDSNYPTANIYMWPVNYSGTTLTMISEKPLTGFSSLDIAFSMPPEYETALIENLAVRMAPEYEKEAGITVKRLAKKSLDMIKAHNMRNNKNVVKVDSAYLRNGRYNIYAGDYT